MPDWRRCRKFAQFTALGAVTVAVLLPGLGLVRDTTGHDWYAAGKLTLTQVMLGVGFDRWSVTPYRTPNGDVMSITRAGLAVYGEPIRARVRILSTIGNHAEMGAIAGATCGTVLLIALGGGGNGRRRGSVLERAAAEARPVPGRVWTRDGVVDGVALPGRGEARIGLVVLSPTELEGVAHVEGFVDVGAPLPGGGIGPKQLAPGAEAARRALALTVPQGEQPAVEQDADSENAVDASKLPAVRGGPRSGAAAVRPDKPARTATHKRADPPAVKPAHRGTGRTRLKKRSPGRQKNNGRRKPAGRRPGPTQDIY